MILKRKGILCLMSVLFMLTGAVCSFARTTAHPDFKNIRSETLNPQSQYYYPKLLKTFLSPDTTMTEDAYHYFYYGAMFQEDYNPYRADSFADELKATEPLYYRPGGLSRSEKNQILRLAEKSIADNPLNLKQLSYMVYAYKELGKSNLEKIWHHKLANLLMTITRSGTGADKEHAIVIVYPSHEFEYFNLSGATVEGQQFEQPYYEQVKVRPPNATETKDYWFDLHHILEQYYEKHPSEMDNEQ